MTRDPYRYFRIEARELADQLAAALLELERAELADPIVQRLLRIAHTLKGAARVVKHEAIADRAHELEDELIGHRDAGAAFPRDRIGGLLALVDAISAGVSALSAPPGEPARPSEPRPPVADDGARIVRAELADMDAIVDGLGELHTLLAGVHRSADGLAQVARAGELLGELVTRARSAGRAGAPSRADPAAARANELAELVDRLRGGLAAARRELHAGLEQIDRELRVVRDAAEQLRLVPASTLLTALERIARDAAAETGRRVAFRAGGGDVRFDAHVIDALQPALVQIVRNAVAHGIEPPVERAARGKPATGEIAIELRRRGPRIVITCRDDGRGIDVDAVRRAAIRRGAAPAAIEALGARELARLLLRGGISTAPAVTTLAGRGIGLDVVRTAIERLGGEVAVDTTAGAGTRLELVVPASLAAIQALVVDSGGAPIAIPLDAVRATIRTPRGAGARGAGGDAIVHDGALVRFAPLAALLGGGPAERAERASTAVIIAGAGGTLALGVDRLDRATTVVIRPLPEHVAAHPIIAGAWFDGDGTPRLLLDPDAVIAAPPLGAPPPPAARRRLLVVDDSLTTRMLEQSILESAGYDVDTATSGEQALERARATRYELFLVDVEMPGMDGFMFVERIRADPALRDIPAILVTSRGSPADLRRGRDAGAQDHMLKSEFDQVRLLARIRELVTG